MRPVMSAEQWAREDDYYRNHTPFMRAVCVALRGFKINVSDFL